MSTLQNSVSPNEQPSVYALGAVDGLWVGLAMSLCFVCTVFASHVPLIGLVAMALFVATPVVVWVLLRRAWVNRSVPPTFSAVWLHGICVFLFGGVLLALVMFVVLQYAVPGWLQQQTLLAAARLAENGDYAQAQQAYRIATSGLLPSPIYTAFSSIWLVSFSGSLWAMLFAAILTRTAKYKKLRFNNRNDYGQQ